MSLQRGCPGMGVCDGFCRTGSDGLQCAVCIDPAALAHARRWPMLTLLKPGGGHPACEAGKGMKGAGSPPALSSQRGGSWLDHWFWKLDPYLGPC